MKEKPIELIHRTQFGPLIFGGFPLAGPFDNCPAITHGLDKPEESVCIGIAVFWCYSLPTGVR